MFIIDEKYKVDTLSYFIANNYVVLHYDQEPVLFSGTNYLGQRVVGSVCCECASKEIVRDIHTVISDELYNDFISRKIDYLTLLSKHQIYVIDKDDMDEIVAVYELPLSEIPQDHRPIAGVFCPEQIPA